MFRRANMAIIAFDDFFITKLLIIFSQLIIINFVMKKSSKAIIAILALLNIDYVVADQPVHCIRG
jgi:hypothetical protein